MPFGAVNRWMWKVLTIHGTSTQAAAIKAGSAENGGLTVDSVSNARLFTLGRQGYIGTVPESVPDGTGRSQSSPPDTYATAEIP